MEITFGPGPGVAVAVLTAAAALLTWLGRLGHSRTVRTAAARATLQPAAVSPVVGAVIASVPLVVLFLGLMTAVAARTAGARICRGRRWMCAVRPVLGAVPFLAVLVVSGVVPLRGIALIRSVEPRGTVAWCRMPTSCCFSRF
jgi:putative ABC transport system permease protein